MDAIEARILEAIADVLARAQVTGSVQDLGTLTAFCDDLRLEVACVDWEEVACEGMVETLVAQGPLEDDC